MDESLSFPPDLNRWHGRGDSIGIMSDSEQTYDELLVLRCQEADEAAFDELLGRWQKRLWQHAWRLVGREDAAWDVLQDALVAISGGIAKLQSPAAFRAWAYRIVTHKSQDWWRKESRRQDVHESYGAEQEHSQKENAPSERVVSLEEAVQRLPRKDRALLALKYRDGFGIEEIASILDLRPGTVKSRLYHARQRLKKAIEETDNE